MLSGGVLQIAQQRQWIPRFPLHAAALIARTQALVKRLASYGMHQNRLLFQIPGTWQGIAAVRHLEGHGVQCQVTHVYTFAQAVAAIKAGASVLVVKIENVNLWYDQHPGAIRDPHV
jgi:transaldolase